MATYYGISNVRSIAVSSNPAVLALQDGARFGRIDVWASPVISYSFPTFDSSFFGGNFYGSGEVRAGFLPLTDNEKQAVRLALDAWASVADIRFQEVAERGTQVGELRFAFSFALQSGELAHTYLPSVRSLAGDVWLNPALRGGHFSPGTDSFHTLLHEIGHTLGLSHPMQMEGQVRTTPALTVDFEGVGMLTIMSYDLPAFEHNTPQTPMLLDVIAIQEMYGANLSSHAGDDAYSILDSQLVWDVGGFDTLYLPFVEQGGSGLIDLRDFSFSGFIYADETGQTLDPADHSLVGIATGVHIENAWVEMPDTQVFGNALGNIARFTTTGGGAFDGGEGVDYVIIDAASQADVVASGDGFTIKGLQRPGGQVTVQDVERLVLGDRWYAVDMDGAGRVAKILGAVFGVEALGNREYVGIGLDLIDAGTSYADLIGLALRTRLGEQYTVEQEVGLIYKNIVGSAPRNAELREYANLVHSGAYTRETLAMLAAESQQNITHIGLQDVLDHGLAYV